MEPGGQRQADESGGWKRKFSQTKQNAYYFRPNEPEKRYWQAGKDFPEGWMFKKEEVNQPAHARVMRVDSCA
jgi:hypothetical protein